ncbi:MAG: ABC transporter substrate-binding protein [Thermoplasmata archaeon]
MFQDTIDVTVADLLDGDLASASFAYLSPSTIGELASSSCLAVNPLPTAYSATSGSWWIYLNQSVYPFNNLSVREAITHAINYQQIITQAFGGYASQWVGPVPPAYPYDNNLTAQEPYYSYDLALAQSEIAASPCADNACKGTTINYMFLNSGADWADTAQFLESDLAAIGITINPVGVSLDQLYEEQGVDQNGQCVSATNANGGPFYMGQEFYTSDYISPDDWTQNDAYSLGSANRCTAGYANATVDGDAFLAASNDSPSELTGLYAQVTQLMYANYSEIWLVVPTAFSIESTALHGVIHNPMGSGESATMGFNSQWATSGTTYPVTFRETGLPGGTTWSVTLNGSTQTSSVGRSPSSKRTAATRFRSGRSAGWWRIRGPASWRFAAVR